MRCSRRTPRNSCAHTCRRAANNQPAAGPAAAAVAVGSVRYAMRTSGRIRVGPDSYGPRLPGPYLSPGTSSFADFLASAAPDLLPATAGSGGGALARDLPHGTTIVAAACDGGVVMAGDRRATAGNMISQRDIQKVFRADDYSCIGIAGVAGIGIDLVRIFQIGRAS